MYYEIMSKPIIRNNKREYILKHNKEILDVVNEMLKPDAPLQFNNYDIYKECFLNFAQEVVDKYIVLNTPRVEYITDDAQLIDKQILIKPKIKSVIECMKKI